MISYRFVVVVVRILDRVQSKVNVAQMLDEL